MTVITAMHRLIDRAAHAACKPGLAR